MANNGFIVNGVCVSGEEKAYDVCSLQYGSRATGANYIYYYTKSSKSFQCHLTSPVEYPVISNSVAPNCEIAGPRLTETHQIEAVNAVFAAVLVALCVIWGVKMVYNTLISNPRGE